MGAPGMFGYGGSAQYDGSFQIDRDLVVMEAHAQMCGDMVTRVTYREGEEINDVRIVMLKAAGKGVYLKEVGIMISDTEFAIYDSRD